MRELSYALAINEALHQLLEEDRRVFILGQGVDNPWYVGSTAKGLVERFGRDRIIDPPISENGMNGFAIGAAIAGSRPIVIHPRLDFLVCGFDQIINQASNWSYVFRGRSSVPMVLWGIINRRGEQGAQHSQAIHAFFAHVPGLKVVLPSTPEDAKGLMVAATRDPNPVVFIDDRALYAQRGHVPEGLVETPIGKARIAREGTDVTIVASSYPVVLALEAAERLKQAGIDAEVVDLRSLKPLDVGTILASVRKTGRLVVVDSGWKSFGISAEIVALAAEQAFSSLVAPAERVALPDSPAPSSKAEEEAYYFSAEDIVRAAARTLKGKAAGFV